MDELGAPQNFDAERHIIGAAAVSQIAMDDLTMRIRARDFYDPRNKIIWNAALDLYHADQCVDIATLREKLKYDNQLEKAGGMDYLASLSEFYIPGTNWNYHADIVKSCSIRRHIIDAVGKFSQEAMNCADAHEVLGRMEKELSLISETYETGGDYSVKEIIATMWDNLENKKAFIAGLRTGYYELDNMLGGLKKSELIIVAGSTSMGKSSLCNNIALRLAENGHSVEMISLEVQKDALARNMLCIKSGVSLAKLNNGWLKDSDWVNLSNAAGKMSELKIYIEDSPSSYIRDLKSRARQMKHNRKMEVLIVDYLQLMRGDGDTKEQEVSSISRGLKDIARTLDICVISAAQLNRQPSARTTTKFKPMLSDLRESGAIEQDADAVLLIYRPEYYFPDASEHFGKADIIVAKNRNGATGTVQMTFLKEFMRFENLTERAENYG